MKHLILEVIGDALVAVFGIWSLLMFISILTDGRVTFIEPNRAILIGETIASGLIVLFGVHRLIDEFKTHKEFLAAKLRKFTGWTA